METSYENELVHDAGANIVHKFMLKTAAVSCVETISLALGNEIPPFCYEYNTK